MKHIFRILFIIVCISASHSGYAQKGLIGPDEDFAKHKISIGDTVVFSFIKPIHIVPLRITENNPNDISSYLGGYLTTNPSYVNEKRKKNPIYTYKGTAQANYTPSSAVSNKEMVVLKTELKELSDFYLDCCIEWTLWNLVDNDTIILRQPTALSKKDDVRLFDTISVVGINKKLKDRFIGRKFYGIVYKDDTLQFDKTIAKATKIIGEWMMLKNYYREYTIVDCRNTYWAVDGIPTINIYYRDNFGHNYEYRRMGNVSDEHTGRWFSVEELDSIQNTTNKIADSLQKVEMEKKRESGTYHFEITKVDKPKNQNVKKGTLTKNNIYEDNIISVKWDVQEAKFLFNLKNMTSNTMKVLWDEALIVNFEGFTERVLHKGADLEALQKAQQPAIIPSLAQLADFYCSERYLSDSRLRYGYGRNDKGVQDGESMRLILPVQVGNTTYTYSFTFTLKWEWSHPELRK